jgi:hypothetical protein
MLSNGGVLKKVLLTREQFVAYFCTAVKDWFRWHSLAAPIAVHRGAAGSFAEATGGIVALKARGV